MAREISYKKAALAKILDSVPFDSGFHFYFTIGNYTGVTATSLVEFADKLQIIDVSSVVFHFQRGDFKEWIRDTLNDAELSKRISMVKAEIMGENLRKELIRLVQTRIAELKTYL